MRQIKINFVYHSPLALGSGYMGSEGFKRALESNDLLHYAYNQTEGVFLDETKFLEAPIFYVRGFLNARMPLVARGGNQFKACWQSESFYTRHGEKDTSTDLCLENQEHFNMLFVCSETDLDMYDIPTYWLPSWADTTVMGERGPSCLKGLGFIGGRQGREDFLDQDVKGIFNCVRTKMFKDSTETAKAYAKLISKFEMLLAPPGRCFNGMCGRAFEIMACNRLCFQWLNEDTMFKHMKFFTDGEDIVYFKTYDELVDKYNYYLKNPVERNKVAKNGYLKIKNFHNQDTRVKYVVDCMEREHKKWLEDQDLIPEEIHKIYEEIS